MSDDRRGREDGLRSASFRHRERGVSEVLGHVLVFSLVVASIALIVLTGIGGLEDTREVEQANNAERAFDVLADNMASVYERNSPSRTTEIDLEEAALTYGDTTQISITGNSTTADNFTREFQPRPLEYRIASDRSLVYEAGAVLRDEPEGGIVLKNPPFLITEDQIHIPMVETRAAEMRQVSGTTVLVRGEAIRRGISERGTYDRLEINVTSPRYELWERYLAEQPDTDCDLQPDTESVVCTISGEDKEVYITLQRILFSIDI